MNGLVRSFFIIQISIKFVCENYFHGLIQFDYMPLNQSIYIFLLCILIQEFFYHNLFDTKICINIPLKIHH